MSAEAKKGFLFLPEGGEMLLLAIAMFLGVGGLLFLMWLLAPSVDMS
jgi:hypothetical protein